MKPQRVTSVTHVATVKSTGNDSTDSPTCEQVLQCYLVASLGTV